MAKKASKVSSSDASKRTSVAAQRPAVRPKSKRRPPEREGNQSRKATRENKSAPIVTLAGMVARPRPVIALIPEKASPVASEDVVTRSAVPDMEELGRAWISSVQALPLSFLRRLAEIDRGGQGSLDL